MGMEHFREELFVVYPKLKVLPEKRLNVIFKKMEPSSILKIVEKINEIKEIEKLPGKVEDKILEFLKLKNNLGDFITRLKFKESDDLKTRFNKRNDIYNGRLTQIVGELDEHREHVRRLEINISDISKKYYDDAVGAYFWKKGYKVYIEQLEKRIDKLGDEINKFNSLLDRLNMEINDMDMLISEMVDEAKLLFKKQALKGSTIAEGDEEDETGIPSPSPEPGPEPSSSPGPEPSPRYEGNQELTSGGKKSRRYRRRFKQTKLRRRKISKKSKNKYTRRRR